MIGEILDFMERSVNTTLDQPKIISILKILFIYIESEKIIRFFTEKLKSNKNRAFKMQIVQGLDMVINIEDDLKGLRKMFRDKKTNLFDSIFEVWAVDPVSAVSLCFLSHEYVFFTLKIIDLKSQTK